MPKRSTLALVLGAAVVGYFVFAKKKGATGAKGRLKTAPIRGGESVSAGTYRVIKTRRQGMTYVSAEGQVGSELKFASPMAGKFTRNVVQEGGALWAEVAPA
jgi:hypothetical protein